MTDPAFQTMKHREDLASRNIFSQDQCLVYVDLLEKQDYVSHTNACPERMAESSTFDY